MKKKFIGPTPQGLTIPTGVTLETDETIDSNFGIPKDAVFINPDNNIRIPVGVPGLPDEKDYGEELPENIEEDDEEEEEDDEEEEEEENGCRTCDPGQFIECMTKEDMEHEGYEPEENLCDTGGCLPGTYPVCVDEEYTKDCIDCPDGYDRVCATEEQRDAMDGDPDLFKSDDSICLPEQGCPNEEVPICLKRKNNGQTIAEDIDDDVDIDRKDLKRGKEDGDEERGKKGIKITELPPLPDDADDGLTEIEPEPIVVPPPSGPSGINILPPQHFPPGIYNPPARKYTRNREETLTEAITGKRGVGIKDEEELLEAYETIRAKRLKGEDPIVVTEDEFDNWASENVYFFGETGLTPYALKKIPTYTKRRPI